MNFIITKGAVVIALWAIVLGPALASDKYRKPPDPTQDQNQKQYQNQGQQQKAIGIGVGVGKGGEASSNQDQDQEQSANNEGVTSTTTTTNSNRFLSLSLMFPNASGCFSGVQAGGEDGNGGDGFAAFFGVHVLSSNCWMDKLASTERDANINARLKCGAKKFRNAVAYEVPRRERQTKCISIIVESNTAMIREENERLEQLAREVEASPVAIKQRVEDAEERILRSQEALLYKGN